MNDQAPRIRLIGRPGSSQAYAIRHFLHRNDIPFEWVQKPDQHVPVCEFDDRTRIENPTIRQITVKLGWFHDPSRAEYDSIKRCASAVGEGAMTVTLVHRYLAKG
jgi:thioredoxin reductase (NADPH)